MFELVSIFFCLEEQIGGDATMNSTDSAANRVIIETVTKVGVKVVE